MFGVALPLVGRSTVVVRGGGGGAINGGGEVK